MRRRDFADDINPIAGSSGRRNTRRFTASSDSMEQKLRHTYRVHREEDGIVVIWMERGMNQGLVRRLNGRI